MRSNSDHADTQLQSAILRIRKRFIDDLDARITELADLLAEIEQAPAPENALLRIATMMHKIAGIGKTLGLPRLGQMAADAERDAGSLLRGAMSPAALAGFIEQLDAMLDYMASLKAKSTPTGPSAI